MADQPGPLDGILEEAAKTQEEVRQNNQGRTAPHPTDSIRSTSAPTVPDDGVRRIREINQGDVDKLNARIIKLEAMILAMRGLVGAAIVGVMYSIYKIRKIEGRQKALEPTTKTNGKVVDVEASVTPAALSPQTSQASEAPKVDAGNVS
jgi:hypothetical protein